MHGDLICNNGSDQSSGKCGYQSFLGDILRIKRNAYGQCGGILSME